MLRLLCRDGIERPGSESGLSGDFGERPAHGIPGGRRAVGLRDGLYPNPDPPHTVSGKPNELAFPGRPALTAGAAGL